MNVSRTLTGLSAFILANHGPTGRPRIRVTYYDWLFDHAFVFVPAQALVGQFLAKDESSFEKDPLNQTHCYDDEKGAALRG